MSDVEIPTYVPGAPWKALVASGQGQQPEILRLWGVHHMGAPFFAAVMEVLGVSIEEVAMVWSVDPDGLRAEMFAATDQRAAVESLMRERIPDINFEPDENWNFG